MVNYVIVLNFLRQQATGNRQQATYNKVKSQFPQSQYLQSLPIYRASKTVYQEQSVAHLRLTHQSASSSLATKKAQLSTLLKRRRIGLISHRQKNANTCRLAMVEANLLAINNQLPKQTNSSKTNKQ
jgi:hypothetical protein